MIVPSISIETNEDQNQRAQKPGWLGYVAVLVLETALTAVLLLLIPVFPIGRYPIPYVLLTMAVAYLFAVGPAILSIFLGWFLFTYFFVPPAGISWPLGHSIESWAQQVALLLGVIVVGTAMIQAKRSNRRIQRLADEAIGLNASLREEISERKAAEEAREKTLRELETLTGNLQESNEVLADTNEELAATNEELRSTTEELNEEVAERRRIEEALRESEQRVRRKLDSILVPEGDLGNLELADIIDVAPIQSLMESFYEFAHIPMAIIDLEGKVLVGVGWQDICTKFHRIHPETCKHCIESDTLLSAGVSPGEFKLYKCKNGMWDVATPIVVGGEHVGNLFSGQFFFNDEPLDYEFFRSQARVYGFDEEEYIAALEDVNRLSRESLDEGMTFFMKLADILSKLSYSNIKLARSLTERDALTDSLRQTEEEIRQLNAELEQRVTQRTMELENANKELEAFSYSVSHDLRAPLRAIDGFSNTLIKNYRDSLDEKGQDYLDRVRRAAQRMGILIDDILGLSRATRAEMHLQKVDMSVMASEILTELQNSQPERKAEITVEQGLSVNADTNLLKIVFDNLLGNAWKFSSKQDVTRIEVGTLKLNSERVYFVRDNGAGFNPDYADKLFSPFQRLHTEADFPGTGIGLALVHRILRRHGGRIWAESEVDKGATFYFTFEGGR